jgi:hypothetical protein
LFAWLPSPPGLADEMPIAAELEREPSQVVGWRFSRLHAAGYEIEDASIIARRTDVDLHYAVELIRRCLNSQQARRIVL